MDIKVKFGLKKRKRPIKEFEDLGNAVDQFKKAVMEEMIEPIAKPVCNLLLKILKKCKFN